MGLFRKKKKNYDNNLLLPLSKPHGTPEASQTTMIVGVQHDPGSARYTERTSIPFVLRRVAHSNAKETLLQQSKRSRSSKTATVNHLPRKKETHPPPTTPTRKGGRTLDCYFLGLDTGLQNPPSFLPPSLPLTHASYGHFCLGCLLPLPPLRPRPPPPPTSLCLLVLLRATADDSGLKQEKEKKARTENPATGRGSRHFMFMGSH